MDGELPDYYSRLAPFRGVFGRGNPILTYHKLGPRPGRVRLKGMYLSRSLFERQLGELQAAGFTSGALAECHLFQPTGRIVITFDDGYLNVLRHGLEPLANTGFRAVQFLVSGLLGRRNEWDVALGEAPEPMMDVAQVREWLAAGHDIGSHTLTHPHLTQLSLRQAQEEIASSRKQLEDLFNRSVVHFCYPFGDWNPAVRDLVQAAGYKTACTTDAGVNTQAVSPFALKRFTARYPTRRLKAFWARWRSSSARHLQHP